MCQRDQERRNERNQNRSNTQKMCVSKRHTAEGKSSKSTVSKGDIVTVGDSNSLTTKARNFFSMSIPLSQYRELFSLGTALQTCLPHQSHRDYPFTPFRVRRESLFVQVIPWGLPLVSKKEVEEVLPYICAGGNS
jgi:hypothetical protein